jgi:TatD DNase family protein
VRLVDSHCHLDDEQFDSDRDAAVERALRAGVERMVVIGTGEGPPDLEAGIRMAEGHAPILATVGIHPQHAAKAGEDQYARLRDLLAHPKVIAVGEIGLDYYWQPFDKEMQGRVFVRQMEIAREFRKPIVIHTREAWEDTLALLGKHWDPTGAACILHCFTGAAEIAERALSAGYWLSFAGVVTYPKATGVQESARLAPLDRMLLETDAPYLPPVPHRGKRNEPAYVVRTAAKIAELRGIPLEALAEAVVNNFDRAFGLRRF